MRGKGINYDTGFFPGRNNSRSTFDPEVVRREMQLIATDLHCTAVRVAGGDPDRLSIAAEHAAAAGLQVWFSPVPAELTVAQLLPYFTDCAERAEDLRCGGADVVLVTGCELSVFAAGFIPGDDSYARLATLSSGDPQVWAALIDVPAQLNAFLAEAAGTARKQFGGTVTYASAPWEDIDWTPFDVVAVDAYRDASNAADYRANLRRYFEHGKPVVATEFGCCTYRGAAQRGGTGWAIVDRKADPPRIDGDYVRDEGEQVRYLHELLDVFDEEGLDGAFWFTFAGYALPHHADPGYDLDMASYGVVAMSPEDGGTTYPGLGWEPKEAFHALAAAYSR